MTEQLLLPAPKREMRNKLCLHCGGKQVERSVVDSVHTPPMTNTHVPVPHSWLVGEVEHAIKAKGYTISGEAHALDKGGDRYFGLFEVEGDSQEYGTTFGVTNFHDKSGSAKLLLGSRVFICDNLASVADFVFKRAHTKNVLRDLPNIILDAVSHAAGETKLQDFRFKKYKEVLLDHKDADHLIMEGLRSNVIASNKVLPVLNEWRKPSHEEFAPRNAWSLFNAFTEVLKNYSNPGDVASRTQRLTKTLDLELGVDFHGAEFSMAI